MGKYSRKDMIEFANYAKSYHSPKKVDAAYALYLKGARIKTGKTPPTNPYFNNIYDIFKKSNVCYVDGKSVRNRYDIPQVMIRIELLSPVNFDVVYWDEEHRILGLKLKRNINIVKK